MYYTIEYYKYPKVNIYKVTKENIEKLYSNLCLMDAINIFNHKLDKNIKTYFDIDKNTFNYIVLNNITNICNCYYAYHDSYYKKFEKDNYYKNTYAYYLQYKLNKK